MKKTLLLIFIHITPLLFSQDSTGDMNPQWGLMLEHLESISADGDTQWMDAFETVDRSLYVANSMKDFSFSLMNILFPDGSEQLSPIIYFNLFRTCQIEYEERVLLWGKRVSYGAAIISELSSNVFGIQSIRDEGTSQVPQVIYGESSYGIWSTSGPFDAIILTSPVDVVHPQLLNMMDNDGVLAAPIRSSPYKAQWILIRKRNDSFSIECLTIDGSLRE